MKKLTLLLLLFSCQKNQLIDRPEITLLGNNTELTVYGIVTSKIIPLDDTHAQIIVQKNGRILELRSVKTTTGISIQSTSGVVYYTQENNTGNIVGVNEIPFYQISITPVASVYTCLRNAVKLCKTSGVCTGVFFTNIFGATSFSFGITLKCALGY